MRVGIVGLGVMGGATGGHLVAAGHDVVGYDTDPAAVERFAGRGADLAELAAGSEAIITWLPSVEALHATAAAVAAHAARGTILIDMGTLPLDAKRIAASTLAGAGVVMLDCPVSGTGAQAADATLVVLASGDEDTYRRVEALFPAMGSVRYLGPFGHGSTMKYIANLLVTINTMAAAEAHAFAAAAGVDPMLVQEVMSEGVGSSRMWDIRGPMMAADSYRPPVGSTDIIKKDAGIITEHARTIGAPTPLLDLAYQAFVETSAAGYGSDDAAAVRRWFDLQS